MNDGFVLIKRWFSLVAIVALLGLGVTFGAHAQTSELSAVVTVVGDGVTLLRAGAINPLPLTVGSVAPFGAGDQLFTGVNGRALIAFPDLNAVYLLPDSRYQLTAFTALDDGRFRLEAVLDGIAVQTFSADTADWDYRLVTPGLTVVRPSEHFAVWALPGRFETVISAVGVALVVNEASPDGVEVEAETGWMPMYSEAPISLEAPYHAVELFALAINCQGTVSTGGTDGLRLRRGAALDYPIVGTLDDGQAVYLVGITQNGLWYRIPYLTGFGWLYSELVAADCADLPVSPNLVGEANETVAGASEAEITLLTPFYGTPSDNSLFYR